MNVSITNLKLQTAHWFSPHYVIHLDISELCFYMALSTSWSTITMRTELGNDNNSTRSTPRTGTMTIFPYQYTPSGGGLFFVVHGDSIRLKFFIQYRVGSEFLIYYRETFIHRAMCLSLDFRQINQQKTSGGEKRILVVVIHLKVWLIVFLLLNRCWNTYSSILVSWTSFEYECRRLSCIFLLNFNTSLFIHFLAPTSHVAVTKFSNMVKRTLANFHIFLKHILKGLS